MPQTSSAVEVVQVASEAQRGWETEIGKRSRTLSTVVWADRGLRLCSSGLAGFLTHQNLPLLPRACLC